MNINALNKDIQQKIKDLNFNKKPARKDITGKVYNKLTVLGRGKDYVSPGGHKSSQWWCITKRIQKIGYSMAHNISNQQFGELIALEPTSKRKNGSVVWKCLCSCGKIHYVSAHDLVNGRIHSCGHSKESAGVRKIKQILNENNIQYTVEKTFLTCKFPDTKASARFDFYINNKFLLEYDGEQHFKELDNKFFKDNLQKRQSYDKFKNEWCKKNNIPLKRIPYYELNNINLEMIMGDKYLI